MNRLANAVAALAATLTMDAPAADAPAPGPSLRIVVENLDNAARQCGLSQESISSQVSRTLGAGGVRAVDTQTNPYLYVNVNVSVSDAAPVCVENISVRVQGLSDQDMTRSQLGVFRAREVGDRFTVLCDSSALVSHPLKSIAAMLTDVERVTKICLGKLEYETE
jgi:hypothetical protein